MPRAKPKLSLRDRLRAATTQAILEATEETLVERGLAATGIAQIAARAGVSVGTLYNHFADRETLIAELMVERARELLQRLDAVEAAPDKGGFRERLGAVAGAFLLHCDRHRRLFQIMLAENSDGAAVVSAVQRRRDMVRHFHDRILRVMKVGAKEGEIGRDATLNAFLFLGLLRGTLMHMHEVPDAPYSSAALAEIVTGVFLAGACAAGGGRAAAPRRAPRQRSARARSSVESGRSPERRSVSKGR